MTGGLLGEIFAEQANDLLGKELSEQANDLLGKELAEQDNDLLTNSRPACWSGTECVIVPTRGRRDYRGTESRGLNEALLPRPPQSTERHAIIFSPSA
ncbi:hypothetical protein PCANC_27243 [Puccinia coronata f. sp. avenae]|uniref:Uncharacterized protein n=1 Tax=Puccinia coronata f. sp. avenae TaxID=200324 RepID=A0A2N5S9A1_9BASI|nr:hypothetical protein PCANC_24454 [Puccinia coronata f. sp. avenae]PLW24524.1 hypothetical protein PCANC_27243 [Puccinia coronata f. sp. avenae]